MKRRILILGAVLAALAGCPSTPPSGTPPLSPREIAVQVGTEYQLLLVGVNAAVHQPGMSEDVKGKIQAASKATSAAVLAYNAEAENCFRNEKTGVIENAPGKVCDQSKASLIEAVAWSQIGQLNGLLAAFAPGTSITLPALPL